MICSSGDKYERISFSMFYVSGCILHRSNLMKGIDLLERDIVDVINYLRGEKETIWDIRDLDNWEAMLDIVDQIKEEK